MRSNTTDWDRISKECFEAVLKKVINDLEYDTNAAHSLYRDLCVKLQKDYIKKDTIKYVAAAILFMIAIIEILTRLLY